MPSRPRILVAVEPRVLGDVLVAVLTALDLDDVVADADGQALDAAIVSSGSSHPGVDLVIEVPTVSCGDQGWVHNGPTSDPVAIASTRSLLALLDDRLDVGASRVERASTLSTTGGGAR